MSYIDYIAGVVDNLSQQHLTHDPFELCDALGVKIHYKDLGPRVKAFYVCESKARNIVINSRVSKIVQRILVAHELGHDRLHVEVAKLKSFQILEPFGMAIPAEYEANLFAADLLIDNDELLDLLHYDDRTLYNIARELYVPEALLDFKLRILKHKGYDIDAPYQANGDFLRKVIVGCFECEW